MGSNGKKLLLEPLQLEHEATGGAYEENYRNNKYLRLASQKPNE